MVLGRGLVVGLVRGLRVGVGVFLGCRRGSLVMG